MFQGTKHRTKIKGDKQHKIWISVWPVICIWNISYVHRRYNGPAALSFHCGTLSEGPRGTDVKVEAYECCVGGQRSLECDILRQIDDVYVSDVAIISTKHQQCRWPCGEFHMRQKCSNHWVNKFACAQPIKWTATIPPSGVPLTSWTPMFSQGHMIRDGMKRTPAFMQNNNYLRISFWRCKHKLRGFSPQANYIDRRLSAKLVPTLADRGSRVVSATNPHGR
jgi:hypothetical protein